MTVDDLMIDCVINEHDTYGWHIAFFMADDSRELLFCCKPIGASRCYCAV